MKATPVTALLFLLLGCGCAAGLFAADPKCVKGTMVFEGIVTGGAGTALAGIPPSAQTFVVKATHVLPSDGSIKIQKGDSVTVSTEGTAPNRAQKVRVYAVGWILGETVAVKEVCRDALPLASAAAGTRQVEAIAAQRGKQKDVDLRREIDSAEMACFGHVTEILPAPKPQPRLANVTEHDPQWRIALVNLSDCTHNATAVAGFRLRFPGSYDVKFRNSSKPVANEDGFFLIRSIAAQCDGDLEPEKCVNGELVRMLSSVTARTMGYEKKK
jgi:hypothetical protein